ncbi:MAG: AAA family ATPase [Candidatus Omnitrophica bacterium]|nr:AAA family ATPase [Candidatus Omnitrophota bacterium]
MPKYELNLRDYYRVIQRRKFLIIFFFLFTAFIAHTYSNSQRPIYETSSVVKYQQFKSVSAALTEWISWTPGNPLETAASTITSFNVVKGAALKIGLIDEESEPEEIDRSVSRLQGQIGTEVIKGTNLIRISVTSSSGREAKEIANAVAESYINESFLERVKETRKAREFIGEQLIRHEETLERTRERLRKFQEKEGIPFLATAKGSSSFIEANPAILGFTDKLVALKLKLSHFLLGYTEKHPQVITLRAEMGKLEKSLSEKFKDLSHKEADYTRLSLDVKINENLYSMFKEHFAKAQIAEAQIAENVTLIGPATEPKTPKFPNKKRDTIFGGLMGIILGLVAAFVRETLDTSIGTVDEVEEFLGTKVLGVIPYTKAPEKKEKFQKRLFRKIKKEEVKLSSCLFTQYPSKSMIAESYGILETNIRFAMMETKGEVLLFTSTTYEEGKTTVAANCALAMAKMGRKVLLIDADLRNPGQHKIFELEKENGLSEFILGTIKEEEAMRGLEDIILGGLNRQMVMESHAFSTLKIIPSGRVPPNPLALLSSQKMSDLIKKFKTEYDIILLDSPPVLPVADSLTLSSKVDKVIIVHQAGRIPRIVSRRIKTQLENSGAKILGIVLNNIRAAEMEPGPGYYYYYGERKKGRRR